MAFGLYVPDDGLDGRATAQLALDDTEDPALLAGAEDATGILRIVAAVPLVDIGPLDRTAGERLGALDDVPQGVPSYGLSGISLACCTNSPPGARRLLVTTEAFTPNW
ncbi:hypothetical protein GGD62_005798 [Bradyrhizobium sp. ERR14]|nr:hypothetical protein [Bradyrhizobium sp. ERR14]